MPAIIKGKDNSRYPLHDNAKEEGHGNRHEDSDDYRQGLVGVQKVGECQRRVGRHLQQGNGKRSAKELEYQRHRRGSRHAKSVEHVKDNNVGNHHGKEDYHHLVERVMQGEHDAMTRHVHHARGHHGSDNDTERSYNHHLAEGCHLGTDGRLEEIDGVVAHTNEKVEYCQT